MKLLRPTLVALVVTTSPVALASPATAQRLLFSTGVARGGEPLAPGAELAGPIVVAGGVTQLSTGDGSLVAFVGDAVFERTADGLRIDSGRFSARAGATPLTVSAADGSRITVAPGAAASLAVGSDGITGRALTGSLSATANGATRTIAAGSAFAANARDGVAQRMTAGAQPVSAPTVALPGVEADENPLLPRFAEGTPAALLRQAIDQSDGAAALAFRSVTPATVDVNLAFLTAGGQPGAFSPAAAGAAVQSYLTALRTDAGVAPSALTAAFQRFLASDGLAGLTDAQRAIIGLYQQVTAAGGTFSDAAAGAAYADHVRALAAGTTPPLGAAVAAAYDAYARQLGFGTALDAARQAQVDAFAAARAAGLPAGTADVAGLLGTYLDHLAAGRDPAGFAAASPGAITAALAYLAALGLPATVDGTLAARIAAYADYVAGGGAIGSLPPAVTPTPTPQPDPTPIAPAPPPVPVPTSGLWVGGAGGDAGQTQVTVGANGAPLTFSRLTVGTAQLVEVTQGPGWIVGRYANGTLTQNYGSVQVEGSHGPNQGIHFGFATSSIAPTISVGTATYAVAGFTRPTYVDSSAVSAATLTGELTLNFGTLRSAFEGVLEATVGGTAQRYVLTSSARSVDGGRITRLPALFLTNVQTLVQTTDMRCSRGCVGILALGSSGANAELLAGTYQFSSTGDAVLNGAVVFGQTALTGQPTGAPAGTSGLEYRGLGIGGNLVGIGAGTVTLGADGTLAAIDGWTRNTAKNLEAGGVAGMIGWTRWADGTIASTDGRDTQAIGANAGRHLIWYRALTALPTSGRATYALAGGTAPTRALGESAPGTLKSGALAVDFGTMRVGFDLGVSYAGVDYAIGTGGGTAAPSAVLGSNGRFNDIKGAMSGNGCTAASCFLTLQGFLAGTGASHAGVTYQFSTQPGGGGGSQVQGVAAFTRD